MIAQFLLPGHWPAWLQDAGYGAILLSILNIVLYYGCSETRRQRLDAMLTSTRVRLQDARIDVLSATASRALAILNRVYGSTVERRIVTLVGFATFYVLAVFTAGVLVYQPFTEETASRFAALERETAGDLFADPAEVDRAYELGTCTKGGCNFAHYDEAAVALRDGVTAAQRALEDRIAAHPGGEALSLFSLTHRGLLESRGRRVSVEYLGTLVTFATIVAWNLVFDGLSLVITLNLVRRVTEAENYLPKLQSITTDAVIAALLFGVVLTSYNTIALGTTVALWQTIFLPPLLVLLFIVFGAMTLGAWGALYERVRESGWRGLITREVVFAVVVTVLVPTALYSVASDLMDFDNPTSQGFNVLRGWDVPPLWLESGLNFMPYGLAITAFLPTAVVLTLLLIALFSESLLLLLKRAALLYVTVIVNMPHPNFLLLAATPLAAVELFGFVFFGPNAAPVAGAPATG
ncbi:MAG: hypothetical protein AAFQ88_12495 [Pseudomonadota bacterium]